MTALPTLVSSKEASSMLGVSQETIANWAAKRKVSHLKTPGGHLRFFVTDLLEFRHKLTVKAID